MTLPADPRSALILCPRQKGAVRLYAARQELQSELQADSDAWSAGQFHQGAEGQADGVQQAWGGLHSLPETGCNKGWVPQAMGFQHAPERVEGAEDELALTIASHEIWRGALRHLQTASTGVVAGLLTSNALMDYPNDYTS